MQTTTQKPRDQTLLAFGMLLLAVSFWASNTVIGRALVETVPAFTLSFWRWTLAMLLLAPFALPGVWRKRRHYLANWRLLCLLSFLGITIYNTFQYWALEWITATKVGIISASLPVFIFLISWLCRMERAGPVQLLSLIISLSGVALVLALGNGGQIEGNFLSGLSPGDGLMLFAVFSFAWYSVLLKKLPAGFATHELLFVTIAIGWCGIVPFYLLDLSAGRHWQLNGEIALALGWIATFPSIVSGLLWLRGLQLGGAMLGGIMYNFLPVVASLLAVLFLGETFTRWHLAGILLVLIGANLQRICNGLRRNRAS